MRKALIMNSAQLVIVVMVDATSTVTIWKETQMMK
jgi:hypothetical protein